MGGYELDEFGEAGQSKLKQSLWAKVSILDCFLIGSQSSFSNRKLIKHSMRRCYLHTENIFLLLEREFIISVKERKREGMGRIGISSRTETDLLLDWRKSETLSNQVNDGAIYCMGMIQERCFEWKVRSLFWSC